jgi:hypothetical protein
MMTKSTMNDLLARLSENPESIEEIADQELDAIAEALGVDLDRAVKKVADTIERAANSCPNRPASTKASPDLPNKSEKLSDKGWYGVFFSQADLVNVLQNQEPFYTHSDVKGVRAIYCHTTPIDGALEVSTLGTITSSSSGTFVTLNEHVLAPVARAGHLNCVVEAKNCYATDGFGFETGLFVSDQSETSSRGTTLVCFTDMPQETDKRKYPVDIAAVVKWLNQHRRRRVLTDES